MENEEEVPGQNIYQFTKNSLKCGEVYLDNGKFLFCCEFCTTLFQEPYIYINHVSFYHCMNTKELVDDM